MAQFSPESDKQIVYQGKMLEIVSQVMSDGAHTATFEWARRAPGVRLIIADLQKQTILLNHEYRYELKTEDYRLPGGKVFDSLEEYNELLTNGGNILFPATNKAKAEALEEAGVHVEELNYFHTSVCGATIQWDLLYFIVTSWRLAPQQLERGEQIVPIEVSFDEAREMALDGRMSEERSALVLLKYLKSILL